MKFTKLALTLMCSMALFCGCAKNDDVVLKINNTEITRAQFYDDFNKIKEAQLKNAPKEVKKNNSYAVLSMKDRYTNDVIIRALLKEEYTKRKIEASEEEIKAKKEFIIKQIGSKEKFDEILKQNNISEERLNLDMANEVKVEKLVNSIEGTQASDKDVEKYYKENKAMFEVPERVKVSHILIDLNPDNIKRKISDADKDVNLTNEALDKKVKEEIARKEKLVKELREKAAKNPKGFAKLAKEYSEDPGTKEKGGDLGFVTRDQVVKEFGDAAFSQKVGTVSQIVKSQFGSHIIYVTDKSAKTTQSLASVKNDLKKYLTEQNKFQAFQKLIEALKSSAKIEYFDDSINPEKTKKKIEEALKRETAKEIKKSKNK